MKHSSIVRTKRKNLRHRSDETERTSPVKQDGTRATSQYRRYPWTLVGPLARENPSKRLHSLQGKNQGTHEKLPAFGKRLTESFNSTVAIFRFF